MYISHQLLMGIWSQQSCLTKFDLHLCSKYYNLWPVYFFYDGRKSKPYRTEDLLVPYKYQLSPKERTSKTWKGWTKRSFLCCINKKKNQQDHHNDYIQLKLNDMLSWKKKSASKKFSLVFFCCFLSFILTGVCSWALRTNACSVGQVWLACSDFIFRRGTLPRF